MSDALIFSGLTKVYKGKLAVDHLSFTVPAGKIFGFVGPNGAGKTTTIKMLCGLLRPTEGTALVNGLDVVTQPKQVRKTIGYVSQQFSLYKFLTVEQNIEFYGRLYGLSSVQVQARKETVIETCGLAAYRHTEAGHLSGGWKQRLALACALVHEPSILILDEPTAGVDPVAQKALWDLIASLAKAGTTFFVSTHSTEDVERCDLVGYLHQGRLLAVASPANLRALPAIRQTGLRQVEVTCSDPPALLKYVRNSEGFFDPRIFPRGVRMMIRKDVSIDSVEAELQAAVPGVEEVHTYRPSLSDVFVTLTEQEDSGIFRAIRMAGCEVTENASQVA